MRKLRNSRLYGHGSTRVSDPTEPYDMRSQVLAGRKNMSIDALISALDQIGYALRIVPKA